MDRGYLDFARWHQLHQCGAFFVTRARQTFRCARRYSRPVDKTTGLRFDQTVVMTGLKARHDYPDPLRRVGYRDPLTGKSLVFLTNNFTVPALTIAELYRGRWQIELFFKWISVHCSVAACWMVCSRSYKSTALALRLQIVRLVNAHLKLLVQFHRLAFEGQPGGFARLHFQMLKRRDLVQLLPAQHGGLAALLPLAGGLRLEVGEHRAGLGQIALRQAGGHFRVRRGGIGDEYPFANQNGDGEVDVGLVV